MSKIYYGALELPKNSRYPTMREAVNAKQVRYWGKKKFKNKWLIYKKKADKINSE